MFEYNVYYHDEEENKPLYEKGIVSSHSYGDAANRLVEYFGKENVITIELTELMDVLCFEELQEMFE